MRVLSVSAIFLLLVGCGGVEEDEVLDDADLAAYADEGGEADPDAAMERETSATARLVVMTQNIRGCDAGSKQLNALANLIYQQNPDVVGLQEVYWRGAPSLNQARDVVKILKARGRSYYYSYQAQQSWVVLGIGVAILSKYPISGIAARSLPKVEKENRVVLHATIKKPGRYVDFFVTHLTNNHANSDAGILQQAQSLYSWMSTYSGKPKILVGDFNATPKSRAYSYVAGKLVDSWAALHGTGGGFTMSAAKPTVRFDYIMLDRPSKIRAISSVVRGSAAISDHLGVVSTIGL